jgi:predicted O-linked N-acetylglucosamine transferase (SPINDLY family)
MAETPDGLAQALEFHQSGQLRAARELYRRILQTDEEHADAWHLLGVLESQNGNAQIAIDFIQRAIALRPTDHVFHSNLGATFQTCQDFERAVSCFRRAVELNPDAAASHINLGNALREQGHLDEAAACFQQALQFDADNPEAHFGIGLINQGQGNLQQAIARYRHALQLRPDYTRAWNNLGTALRDADQLDEALNCFRRALSLDANFADAHCNMGSTLRAQRMPREALASFQTAVRINPQLAVAHVNIGDLLQEQGQLDPAELCYRQALQLQPQWPELHNSLGIVLQDLGKIDEAIASYQRALHVRPGDPRACNNLGAVYQEQGAFEQAVVCYRQATESAPGDSVAHLNLGNALSDLRDLPAAVASYERARDLEGDSLAALCQIVFQKKQMCDWRNLQPRVEELIAGVEAGSGSISPFTFINLPGTTAAHHFRCARQASAARLAWLKPVREKLRFTFADRRSDKIRIGYVSGDFRQHAMSSLFTEMFERHDRSRFEIVGYSFGADDGSEIRRRILDAFDHTVDIRATSFVAAAQRIHHDRIDILVDLTVHQQGARNEIFALRPAPIQVNYLAYPGTSGMDEMDYILVDPFVVPQDQQDHFSEELVHLPDCYQANDSHRLVSEPVNRRAALGLPEVGTVFGCFNQPYKITAQMFELWTRVLRRVDKSVLWIWDDNSWVKENLRAEAQRFDVEAGRLVFAQRLPMAKHLARYAHVDLVLDTFPYTGHTTTSDAFWVGCPVLTLVGDTFPSRVAGSLLHTIGLPDLAVKTVEEYEQLAVELGNDRRKLLELRHRVLAGKVSSSLFDSGRLTRHLERAYTQMWETFRSGASPSGFAVPTA